MTSGMVGRHSRKSYLDKYYPLNKTSGPLRTIEQIKAMQKFYHLTVTGMINAAFIKIIELARCGLPDISPQPANPQKWNKTALTYRINNYTPDLPKAKVDEIIPRAFKVWSDVTPLTFRRVSGPADIEIWFAYFAHGDNNPFDGTGGTLAHCFLPGDGLGGDAHFDESEKWSETNKEINLELVAMHEFGHSLGLNHSDVKRALMYPTYLYFDPTNYHLPDDDRRRIQELYGKFSTGMCVF
ncbi:matrix metalloproteinase-18-like [Paroedura picta]|uniref:matrix metalloproteinase-18-like n=1 Tax=Paroedura picta TaxID=143630 RepID=UPI004055F56D